MKRKTRSQVLKRVMTDLYNCRPFNGKTTFLTGICRSKRSISIRKYPWASQWSWSLCHVCCINKTRGCGSCWSWDNIMFKIKLQTCWAILWLSGKKRLQIIKNITNVKMFSRLPIGNILEFPGIIVRSKS